METEQTQKTLQLTKNEIQSFQQEGYLIRRNLFSVQEAESLISHFMDLHRLDLIPEYGPSKHELIKEDSLRTYPRIMQPHRFDKTSLSWLLDFRIAQTLRAIMEEEPIATQSMFYFKPPGSRGQSLHQDNFYLRVAPKTCIAAWIALDHVDPENGGLQIVPGTQQMKIACPEASNPEVSFSIHHVPPPEGKRPIPANLNPGDTLFFNGSLIHGSTPNRSTHRFRRSMIFHYGPTSMREISEGYRPLLDMQGRVIERACAAGGGPCGGEVSNSFSKTQGA